jgi:hypothetical protein
MAHHEVILPLEGKLLLPTNNDFILMDVKFFIPADKPSSDQRYASTRVEDSKICLSELTEDDNEERIVALAYDKTELALNLLSFVIKRAISIGKGGYCIGEVDETTNQVPRYLCQRSSRQSMTFYPSNQWKKSKNGSTKSTICLTTKDPSYPPLYLITEKRLTLPTLSIL